MKLGILGKGMIVKDFLTFYNKLDIEEATLFINPGKEEEAQELCDKYGLKGYVTDYNELLGMDIDTIYVALPNHLHYMYAKKALLSGKNVIIEKPITTNVRELKDLEETAKAQHKIMIEAMSIHYQPAYMKLKKYIEKVGQVKIVSFNFSQYSSRYDAFKKGDIMPAFDYTKAGGALMDINVYNIHAVLGLFGKPESIHYQANIERNIDTSGILTMKYDGFQAVCIGAKDCSAPIQTTIQGEKGTILIKTTANSLNRFTFTDRMGREEVVEEEMEHRMLPEFQEFIHIIETNNHKKAEEMLCLSMDACEIMEEARKQENIVFKF